MRLIDADILLKSTIYNPLHVPHITEHDVIKQPTVDAVPVKHGKWLRAYGDHEAFGVRPFYRYCSECNEATVFPYNYCPNCGSKMDGGEHEID